MKKLITLLSLLICTLGITACGQTANLSDVGTIETLEQSGVDLEKDTDATEVLSGIETKDNCVVTTEIEYDPIELWKSGVSYRAFGEAWFLINTEEELKSFVETPYAGLNGLGEACADFDFTENSLVVYYVPAGSHCVEYTLTNSAIDREELTLTFDVYRPTVQDGDIMQYAFAVPVPKSSNITRCNGMEKQPL